MHEFVHVYKHKISFKESFVSESLLNLTDKHGRLVKINSQAVIYLYFHRSAFLTTAKKNLI